jgi:hypothetical protein
VVPSSLVLAGPLQSNGWPGRLLVFWIAAAVLLGWAAQRRTVAHTTSPVQYGCWILILGLACAIAASWLRPLTAAESAGVVRFALVMVPLAVLALGLADLADRRTAELLLAGLVAGATLSALVACAQFIHPFTWEDVLRLPGFVPRAMEGPDDRGGFLRVMGASRHPIEFGVITGAAVPLAMHFARFGKTPRVRQASTASALVLLASIPMSVSRSGILVVLVAIGVYAVTLSVRQRVTALVLGIAGLALYRAAVPGLLGAVVGIFRQSSDDTSVDSRTRSWTVVAEFFEASPWLGHGLGTFRPEEYIYLDNQYLMSLVEGGLVLLVTTVIVILLSLASTRGAKARARNATDVSLSQAVQAAVAAIAVSGAFFDLFSFAQVTVMFFVLLGVSGALWHDAVLHGRVIPSALERAGLPDPRTGPLAPERH